MLGVGCILPEWQSCSASVLFKFPTGNQGQSLTDNGNWCQNKANGATTIDVAIVPSSALGCGGKDGATFTLQDQQCNAAPRPICASYVGVKCDSCTGS